jgi:large subunit ribosomal protein L4
MSISVDILDLHRKKVGKVDISAHLFDKLEDKGDIYFALKAFENNSKRKVGYTKGRSEIKGSMKKMYKQKGTGQARHSTSKAPQFVGGGIAFGPKGIQRSVKVNRKVWRRAIQVALVEKIKKSNVLVFDDLTLKGKKTKEATKLFPEVVVKRVLFVDEHNQNLDFSVRNLARGFYKDTSYFTIADMLHNEMLVFSKKSFDAFLANISKTVTRRKAS